MAIDFIYNVTNSVDAAPIPGVLVLAFSDAAMTALVAAGMTGADGNATLRLADGTFYGLGHRDGWDFGGAQTFTVLAGVTESFAATGALSADTRLLEALANGGLSFALSLVTGVLRGRLGLDASNQPTSASPTHLQGFTTAESVQSPALVTIADVGAAASIYETVDSVFYPGLLEAATDGNQDSWINLIPATPGKTNIVTGMAVARAGLIGGASGVSRFIVSNRTRGGGGATGIIDLAYNAQSAARNSLSIAQDAGGDFYVWPDLSALHSDVQLLIYRQVSPA